jgi:O-antigen ligase
VSNAIWTLLPTRLTMERVHARWPLKGMALALVVILPGLLIVSRAAADASIAVVAVLFLVDRAGAHDMRWIRSPWVVVGLLLWAWMVLCSVAGGSVAAFLQSLVLVRFFLFVLALESWVLVERRPRQVLHAVVILVTLWIVVECWQQYVLGTNVFGEPRFGDGALTGPFTRPRAGPVYLQLFFPAILPALLFLTNRADRLSRIAAGVLLAVSVLTMILIGQRMPTVLLLFGLCLTALLFKRFRLPILVTFAVGGVLLALTPIVSPPTFAKLVVKFSEQMDHFWTTQYGMLFARAVTMIQAHPWLGLGWDGFRNHCMDPQYMVQPSWLPAGDPSSALGCAIHPHNYWTQIGTSAGVPGIVLFAVLVGMWLWRMGGRGLRRNGRRAALLIFLIVSMWPIASTTSLFTVPNAGFTFLMIGWGLAEATRPAREADAEGAL